MIAPNDVTTVKISKGLLKDLKLLKTITNTVTYDDGLKEIVHEKLCKTLAFTKDGYYPIGTVLKDREGKVLVIEAIVYGKVLFTDATYALNGSGAVWHLSYEADSVANYEGEITHV